MIPGGGQEMAVMVGLWQKILVTTIQVYFVLIPSEAGMRTQIDLNCCYKFFVIDKTSQSFLGRHLNFTIFSPWPSCVGLPDLATPFLQLEWLFLSRYISPLTTLPQSG